MRCLLKAGAERNLQNNTTFAACCLHNTTRVCCVWRQQIVDLCGTPYAGIDIEYMFLLAIWIRKDRLLQWLSLFNDCLMNFVPCCKPYGRIQLWVCILKTPLLSSCDMFSDDAQVFQMWRQMKSLWHYLVVCLYYLSFWNTSCFFVAHSLVCVWCCFAFIHLFFFHLFWLNSPSRPSACSRLCRPVCHVCGHSLVILLVW